MRLAPYEHSIRAVAKPRAAHAGLQTHHPAPPSGDRPDPRTPRRADRDGTCDASRGASHAHVHMPYAAPSPLARRALRHALRVGRKVGLTSAQSCPRNTLAPPTVVITPPPHLRTYYKMKASAAASTARISCARDDGSAHAHLPDGAAAARRLRRRLAHLGHLTHEALRAQPSVQTRKCERLRPWSGWG